MPKIRKLESVDSTNSFVSECVQNGEKFEQFETVIAKEQTAGRGKFPAAWFSKANKSLMMSTFIRLDKRKFANFEPSAVMMIGAICAQTALGSHKVTVKFPNDLYLGENKLAGVLGELICEDEESFSCVVGIGLNVDLEKSELPFVSATSLKIEGLFENDFETFTSNFVDSYLENFEKALTAAEKFESFKLLTIKDGEDLEKELLLIPAIVQNCVSKEVLMLGYMNCASFVKTVLTSKATFWSRSRNALWTKGETSQNFLHVEEMFLDCDKDTLLISATPSGPTCHTGNETCFFTRLN